LLLLVLSVTAGWTDTISFLGLNGLFTAHITCASRKHYPE
jgi:uncharacterized membrane protein YoaK (UPF0700 family)